MDQANAVLTEIVADGAIMAEERSPTALAGLAKGNPARLLSHPAEYLRK